MTEVTNESSLQVARRKLASVLEIYAPLSVGREQTLQALTATLVEFEAAVREDERGIVALEALAAFDAAALEAKNTTTPAPVVVEGPVTIEGDVAVSGELTTPSDPAHVPPPAPPAAADLTAPKIEVPTDSKVVTEPKKKKGRSE